jgi:hypothetical protein
MKRFGNSMENLKNELTNVKVEYNSTHLAEYEKNGYLIIDNVFCSDLICEVKTKAAPFGVAPDYPVVLNIHSKLRMFGEIMLNNSLMELMSDLHAGPVCGLTSQYLFKRHNTKYGRQSWQPHQDNAYPKAPNGHYTIVHLAIDPSTKENGGLTFWKGSHVEEILPYDYKLSWMEDADDDGITRPGWKIKNIPNEYPMLEVDLKPGSICVMHGNLIHGSTPNLSNSDSREQYSMGYCKVGSPFLKGVSSVKRIFTRKELMNVPTTTNNYDISGK